MKVWNTNPFLRPLLVALIGSLLVGRAPAQTFTTLHSFTGLNSDGSYPYASLILSGNTLYGSTQYGAMGDGTVFAINSDGTDFATLHSFTATSYYANTNGAYPGGLILSGNTLYGTTQNSSAGSGTVFKVNTDGTGFATLHSFPETSGFGNTNSDGSYPWGNLILSGKTLYGTAVGGGNWGKGTVFSLN